VGSSNRTDTIILILFSGLVLTLLDDIEEEGEEKHEGDQEGHECKEDELSEKSLELSLDSELVCFLIELAITSHELFTNSLHC